MQTADTCCDLLIAHAECVVPMVGVDLPGGWVAIKDGFIVAVGTAGTEPRALRVVDAGGCLVTPGLVNAHHHMYQSLNRNLVVKRTFNGLVEWLNFYYPIWERLDEEGAYLSTWISLAELALDGCTTSSDHLNVHPQKKTHRCRDCRGPRLEDALPSHTRGDESFAKGWPLAAGLRVRSRRRYSGRL